MSGHTPTLLELTPVPIGTAIAALSDVLVRNYHLASARRSEHGPGKGRLIGSITLGDTRLTFEANTRMDPEDGSRELLTVDLDSRAYEAAYDLLREEAHAKGRQALVDFCIEVTATTKSEGFRLKFSSDEDDRPLTAERLIEAMTTTDRCGLVCGISKTSALSDQVRGYWFKNAKESAGYLVVTLI